METVFPSMTLIRSEGEKCDFFTAVMAVSFGRVQ